MTVYTKRPALAKDESNIPTLDYKERESDDIDFHRVNGQDSDKSEYHQKYELELQPDVTPVLRATYEYCNGDCTCTEIREDLETKSALLQ